ncbi:LacI family DNA-binding transcriptional regulator [Actinoplanes sp. NPDC000266]
MEHLRGIETVAQEAGAGLVVSVLRRGEFVRTDGAILAATSGQLAGGPGRAALEEAGLTGFIEHGSYSYETGLVAAKRLLERENRPTAIVASSDNIVLGVLDGARRRGLDVPGDLSVTGFDDLPASRWSPPPLTTVRQPLREMGRLAGRTILRLLDGKPVEWHNAELTTELIARASTAAPR